MASNSVEIKTEYRKQISLGGINTALLRVDVPIEQQESFFRASNAQKHFGVHQKTSRKAQQKDSSAVVHAPQYLIMPSEAHRYQKTAVDTQAVVSRFLVINDTAPAPVQSFHDNEHQRAYEKRYWHK